jgi:hypothetical protein
MLHNVYVQHFLLALGSALVQRCHWFQTTGGGGIEGLPREGVSFTKQIPNMFIMQQMQKKRF